MTEKRFRIIGNNYTNIDVPTYIVCKEGDCCFELYEDKEDAQRVCDKLNSLVDENEQLKQELKIYRKVANCDNCAYHHYDWVDDGDEFEVCDKGDYLWINIILWKLYSRN